MRNPLGIKSSSINASNPFAERILSLSEIDSKYQNGEIDQKEALKLALELKDARVFTALVVSLGK